MVAPYPPASLCVPGDRRACPRSRQTPAQSGSTTSWGCRSCALCRHSVPGPACSFFPLLLQDKRMDFCWDPWQVSALAPPAVWLAPAWAHSAASPGGSDGHRAGEGPVGVGRTAQDLGRVGSGVGGVGSHLARLPPLTLSPSYRGASRPPMATCPTPGPAAATTAWQPWPPRPSWVSSGCPLLPWESNPGHWRWEGQGRMAAGGTAALLDARVF